jgi:hypothetical protein
VPAQRALAATGAQSLAAPPVDAAGDAARAANPPAARRAIGMETITKF